MANLQKLAERRSEILWFSPHRIKIKEDLNGRHLTTPDNVEHINDLVASIEANGFMQSKPLEIFTEGEDIFISDGHCRLSAALRCNVEKVPCVPEPKGTNEVDRILNQSTHNSAKRLTALEEGRNIKRAMALGGLSEAEVAGRIGKSTTYVGNILALMAAPAELQSMVKAGEVSPTLAIRTAQAEGGAQATETLRTAVAAAREKGKTKATARDVAPKPPINIQIDVVGELKGALRGLLADSPLPADHPAVVIGFAALRRAEAV